MLYRNDLIQMQRERIGKSVDDLRRETKLSADTIRRAEKGDNMSIKKLKAIAKAIHIHPKHLLDEAYELPPAG